ncbi:MAG: type II secretion system F family protein [Sedimentisphaerales bacterium]|nr:type II secretion system F family protein [Sedimentisphaerales bacterium]
MWKSKQTTGKDLEEISSTPGDTYNYPDSDTDSLIAAPPADYDDPTHNSNPHTPASSDKKKNSDYILHIKPSDLCTATRQLATLIRAGMPLLEALAALAEQFQKHPLAEAFSDIHEQVKTGHSLAAALSNYPTVFSNLYVNMVKAGQESGTLEDILFKLAQYLYRRSRLTSKIKAALTYPLFMSIAALSVIIFLMTFVIPGITRIFLDMNHQLPWPTTLLITISDFCSSHFLFIIIALGAAIVSASFYLKSESGKINWDRFSLKLPLFGSLMLKTEMIRFCRTLGILLSSGITMTRAILIVRAVIQNTFIADKISLITEDINKGLNLSSAIKKLGLFPPILYHTLSIGEKSGNLEEQLSNFAESCDEEIEIQIRAITSLIEPVILLCMGFIIGFIVLALLLPIFEINQML